MKRKALWRKRLAVVLGATMLFSANTASTSAEEEEAIVINQPDASSSENTFSANEKDKEEDISYDSVSTDNFTVTLSFYSSKLNGYGSLSASEIKEDSDEYARIIETLSNKGIVYDRIAPLDVSIRDIYGNEFEPEEGSVKALSINTNGTQAVEEMLEDMDSGSIKVVHLKNNDDIEIVADNSDQQNEDISVEKENEGNEDEKLVGLNTEFEIDSFSPLVFVGNTNVTDEGLTVVPTVSCGDIGFNMYMLDTNQQYTVFGSQDSDYAAGDHGTGSIRQGLYTNTTQGDGEDYEKFPVLKEDYNGKARNLKDFLYGKKVDNLFIKEYRDKYSNFYFNSAEYFASLKYDDNEENFTVFQELGTPSNSNQFYYQRGNFMPYNTLDKSKKWNKNLYKDTGEKLVDGDDRYKEQIYGFKESNDYYFGLYGYGYFFQPINGQIFSQKEDKYIDMTYEFIGDDDMLVYIDGVLVLDLGGIHDGQTGTINFKTGEVTYSVANLQDVSTLQNQGIALPEREKTTIRAMFEEAGQAGTENWEESADGKTFEFADGKKHLLQMFYLERGAGASNLKLDFNLTPVPNGAVTVRKAVSLNDAMVDYSKEYDMVILDSDGNPLANAEYYYDNESSDMKTTDETGVFTLKPRQTAVFPSLTMDKTYKFKEKSSDYQYVDEYVVTDKKGNKTTYYFRDNKFVDDDGNEWEGIRPSEEVGKSDVSLVIDNNFHTADLKINKRFFVDGKPADNAPDMDEFNNANFVLQQYVAISDSWKDVTSVSYNSFTDGSFALDDLMLHEKYRIVEAVSENSATEVDSGNYENVDGGTDKIRYSYTEVKVGSDSKKTDIISDEVALEESDEDTVTEITFTNYYETYYAPPTGVNLPKDKAPIIAVIILMISSAAVFVAIDRKRRLYV